MHFSPVSRWISVTKNLLHSQDSSIAVDFWVSLINISNELYSVLIIEWVNFIVPPARPPRSCGPFVNLHQRCAPFRICSPSRSVNMTLQRSYQRANKRMLLESDSDEEIFGSPRTNMLVTFQRFIPRDYSTQRRRLKKWSGDIGQASIWLKYTLHCACLFAEFLVFVLSTPLWLIAIGVENAIRLILSVVCKRRVWYHCQQINIVWMKITLQIVSIIRMGPDRFNCFQFLSFYIGTLTESRLAHNPISAYKSIADLSNFLHRTSWCKKKSDHRDTTKNVDFRESRPSPDVISSSPAERELSPVSFL